MATAKADPRPAARVDVEGQRRRLRKLVDDSGKSDSAVSREAGLTPNYVHNFTKNPERGKKGMSLRDAKALAGVLRTTATYLLEGHEESGEVVMPVPRQPQAVDPGADPFPARRRMLGVIEHRLDKRMRDWLLSLNEEEHAGWSELEWFEEAKRIYALVTRLDGDPGLPLAPPPSGPGKADALEGGV